MGKNILVTGAGGFIGHHFVNYVLENTDFDVIATYRKNTKRIPDSPRVNKIKLDLENKLDLETGHLDYIVHMAAETYVDASLEDSIPFVKSNYVATANLFEWIKRNHPKTITCFFSSDEVLGPAPEGVYFKEEDIMRPSSPYSATKAGAEMLAHSFAHSFGIPIFTVRCMNVFGENESPEKFIPKTINSILRNQKIVLHGKNKDDVSSRHWVYAKDVADAVLFLLDRSKPKEIYHLAGLEIDVYSMAKLMYKAIKGMDLPDSQVEFVDFHKSRPGHDKRYSLSMEKLKNMGWSPKHGLEECFRRTAEQLSESISNNIK